ncbi:MAG TPA: hypothetical protein PLG24_06820, partial [Saprospiraceae bacterium]|nr:hypothetical protein [Saprospiraceae bacterium]
TQMLITFHSVPLGIFVTPGCPIINHLPTSCLPPPPYPFSCAYNTFCLNETHGQRDFYKD